MSAVITSLLRSLGIPALIFIVGLFCGWKIKSTITEADQAETLKVQLEQQVKDQEIARKTVNDFFEDKKLIQVVHDVVEKEVPKYITVKQRASGDCNPTNGVVRLLNESTDTMLKAASRANAADPGSSALRVDFESSEITEDRLILYTAKIRRMYAEARLQCNKLIEFEENARQ